MSPICQYIYPNCRRFCGSEDLRSDHPTDVDHKGGSPHRSWCGGKLVVLLGWLGSHTGNFLRSQLITPQTMRCTLNVHWDERHISKSYRLRRSQIDHNFQSRARDSIRHYVGPSVRWLVGRSEITSLFQVFRAERRSVLSYCPCPTTILPLPTRTRLMLPCIRPCYKTSH